MKYRFSHKRPNGVETGYVDKWLDVKNDSEAIHIGIGIAKEIYEDGLRGTLLIEGTGKNMDYSFSIPLDDIGSIVDPFADLPEEEFLAGYDRVMEIYMLLWPWEGEQKCSQPMNFMVFSGQVSVSCSRPRGCLVSMQMNGEKVDAYHMGPSLAEMMISFSVTEPDARKIWSEVLAKLEATLVLFC